MSFISTEFIIFFGIVYLSYIFLDLRGQNNLLLVASFVFYGWWDWRFLSLIVISASVDFWCGLKLDRTDEKKNRNLILIISILTNIGILGVFKYFDFFAGSLQHLINQFGYQGNMPLLKVILPVGISFYTFQTLSYTIDVYRRKMKPAYNYFDFTLYVSFFPQLVAGPIERGQHFLPQVLASRTIQLDEVLSGLQLTFWGFFKKMVIADNLALIVNSTFSQTSPDGGKILIATYAFAFQIYCDFSGYTDIARGVSRMMGFKIMENFRMPYISSNPSEFWSRWHISLSSWFRDYLYIPLGGNKVSAIRTYINLILTMLIAGLWHGAAWNFVFWGLYHGIILIVYRFFSKVINSIRINAIILRRIGQFTFFQLTCFGWLLFRCKSLDQVIRFSKRILLNFNLKSFAGNHLWSLFVFVSPLLLIQYFQLREKHMEPWLKFPVQYQVFFLILIFYSLMFLTAPENDVFIYFQF